MSKIFCRLAPALVVLIFSCVAFGDDFKSETFSTTFGPIRVHGGQFMVIRNFTQDTGSTRGTITVSKPPADPPVNVLSATILDDPFFLEPINSIVIAGPAEVNATCGTGATACFISYKKDNN